MEYINKNAYSPKGSLTPQGIVIHNDAGSINATAKSYVNSLPNHPAELGFAHYYIDRFTTYRAMDTFSIAWHCGNSWGNGNLLSYEVCQSGAPSYSGVSDAEFLQNEEATFKQVAEDMKFYGLVPSRNTVFLHRALSATDCPWRSWQLHVGRNAPDTQANRNKLIDYFVSRIEYYINGGNTPSNNNNSGTTVVGGRSAFFDLVNVNSGAFNVKGWFIPSKSTKGQTIWLYFLSKDGKNEFGRFKGTRINRPDVKKAFPSNPNGEEVGFEFNGLTPQVLMGKEYTFLLRYNNDNKEELHVKDKVFVAPKAVNAGNLDILDKSNNKLRIAGWHLDSKQGNNHHFLIIRDKNTSKEYTRFDITKNSMKSPDIEKLYDGTIAQRTNCRFDFTTNIAEFLKGKEITVLSRYCSDSQGNNGISADLQFGKSLKL